MKMLKRMMQYHKKLFTVVVALSLLSVIVLSTPAQAAPEIITTPTSGAPGTSITINGIVFDSYKGDDIYIFFDDTEIAESPLIVNEDGTFTVALNIPDDIDPGTHWIEARSDIKSTSMLAKSFFIVEEAEIKLDVADGPVGTVVTISGNGFHSGRTITFYYYNVIGEKLGTELASAVGKFSYHFNVPYSTAGEHKITATNAEGASVETEFEVIPSLALNLSSAGPGELLTVTGTGFGYKTEVDIDFGINPVAKARTDEFGNFEVEFNIPEVKPGPYDVKALDEDGNLDKTQFNTTAGVKLNKTTGSVTDSLTVKGSGFKVGGTVTIDYDKLRVATITADNNGGFSASFNVPAGNSGSHVIIVSDGETIRQLAFTVESEPPPAPELLLPANSSETRAEAYLDWQDVTDPSPPVTYSLQVSNDQNFSSLVLQKDGLTASEYTLSEGEELVAVSQNAPYYWRVKAIDGANNVGKWSVPWSFYVSAPPVPVLLLPVAGSQAVMPLFFNWQGVTSLSPPVTYSLQVANDLNFTSIVLEKEGLTDSEYTLTEEEEEELSDVKEEAPYYWRVRARDSANNESEWSVPQAFYTASSFSLPGWLLYTLLAIVVIAVGYLAFRVGRRTAFRQAG